MKKFKDLTIRVKQGIIIGLLLFTQATLFACLYQFRTIEGHYSQLMHALDRQVLLLKLLAADVDSAEPVAVNTKEENTLTLFRKSWLIVETNNTASNTSFDLFHITEPDQEVLQLMSEINQLLHSLHDLPDIKNNSDQREAINGIRTKVTLLRNIYQQQQNQLQQIVDLLWVGALVLVGVTGFMAWWIFKKYIDQPLQRIVHVSQRLANGDLTELTEYTGSDEIGKIALATDTIIHRQLQLSEFAEKIGDGQFDVEEGQVNTSGKLGVSLMTMRDKLYKISLEDKKRSWAIEGLAKFSDILHTDQAGIQALSEKLIVHLVKYMHANQGTVFLVRDENKEQVHAEAIATYAWERKRFTKKQIAFGEGLIGQVMREGDTIYMDDIPADYVSITSGLGKAKPTCILIVPLKYNNEIHGIIELASFSRYESFEIEFVEKLAESIASTLATVKVNERTQKLLTDAQEMNEHMRTQEEEMRQNLEELSSTQEEMQRKELELSGFISSIDITLGTAEFDLNGYLLQANDIFCRVLGYTLDEIKGKHHRMFVDKKYAESDSYQQLWRDLNSGKAIVSDLKRVTRSGSEIWLSGSYNPVFDSEGRPRKIIKLAQDITDRKKDEIRAKELSLVANNTNNAVIITNKQGLIVYVNKGFTQLTGYTLEEVLNKKPGSFLQGPETDPETVRRIREKLRQQIPFQEEILNYRKDGRSYWISIAINPIFSDTGELDKYIAIQTDITDTKIKNLDFTSRLEAINRSNAIVEFDIEGYVLDANESFLRLMGYTLDEVIGKHHTIFVRKDEQSIAESQTLWKNLASGQSFSGEFPRITKSDQEIWLNSTYNVMLNIHGQPHRVIKVAQDITTEKQLELNTLKQAEELQKQGEQLMRYTAELEDLQRSLSKRLEEAKAEMKIQIKELEAEQAKNAAILEGCVDGVICFSDRGTVTLFNKAAEEIWGKSRQEVLRQSITLLMPLAFVENKDGHMGVVLLENERQKEITIRTEAIITTNTGEEISVLLTLSQAQLDSGTTYTLFIQKISVELF